MFPRRRRTGQSFEDFSTTGTTEIISSPLSASESQTNKSTEINYDSDYVDDIIEQHVEVMASRDRTNEFINTIQSLQGRNIALATSVKDARRSKALQTYSEFMLLARNIGKNVSSTYTKLEKLTLLAKRKSLFDDRGSEIQELTYIIKSDLGSLNQQIAQLQDISKSQQRHNGVGKHLRTHSSSVVLTLQSKLASMSTDFKQILDVRTENLKHQMSRREQFSQGGLPLRSTVNNQGSLLLQEQDHVSIDLDNAALIPQQQRGQLSMSLMYDETDNYLQSRAETMHDIESTIVELGGIFQQLAHIVTEQEENVERIDANVQDAELNIEAAHTQILKYFQSVSSNRWLMIKVFGVLLLFFIFFVVFLA